MPEGPVTLKAEEMQAFLDSLAAAGRTPSTLETYERSLRKLRDFHAGAPATRESLVEWHRWLQSEGYSASTVNLCASVANGFLSYIGRRDMLLEQRLGCEDNPRPTVTRREYLRMLRAARAEGKERVYLYFKVFATMGISVQELHLLTLEAVKLGSFSASGPDDDGLRTVMVPEGLREELIDYCRRTGVKEGPVFLSRKGVPVRRTAVSDSMRFFCVRVGLDSEKANPSCLRQLYYATQEKIRRNLEERAMREYARLLAAEQKETAWERQDVPLPGSA